MAKLVPMASNQDLELEKQAEVEAQSQEPVKPEVIIPSLSTHLDRLWSVAQDAKDDIEDRFLAAVRARNSQYDESQMAAFKAAFGNDYYAVFSNITSTKCRAAEAWIIESIFQTGKRPYSISPTPIPELPKEVEAGIQRQVISDVVDQAFMQLEMAQNQPMQLDSYGNQMEPQVNIQSILSYVDANMEEVKDKVQAIIKEKANESAEQMTDKVDDQFWEGGWYQAVQRAIYDFVTLGTMVIKGPCLRKYPLRTRDFDPNVGNWADRIEERIIPVWERRSPFNIFPSPDSTAVDDGWIFDRIQLSRKALYELIGVPGYNEDEIRAVLREHRDGGLRDWTSVDRERVEAQGNDSSVITNSETIECLEFYGSIPGSLLIEWGLTDAEISDPEREYEAIVWKIGSHVIKAMLNPDPLKKKYFYRASFSEDPDSFWGRGIYDLIESVQTMANATARHIAHNIAIASGPQVEVNMDRLAPGESAAVYPWKVWKTTNQQMQEGEAIRFYQPNIITQRLIEVYNFCMALADEESGVPRYMQGNAAGVTGAGETASGLNMLMSHAAKGLRNAIRNIDFGVIVPSVEQCYMYNMNYENDVNVVGDLRIIPQGSTSLAAKEQLSIRRTEFLNTTANPIDVQLIGLKGRRKLLKESLRSIELDPDEIMGDDDENEQEMMQQQMMAQQAAPPSGMGGSPKKAAKSLGPDGTPVAGRDNQEFASQQGVRP